MKFSALKENFIQNCSKGGIWDIKNGITTEKILFEYFKYFKSHVM
jgi:hypothetical protein